MWAPLYSALEDMSPINSNNFASSAALVAVCALMTVMLVIIIIIIIISIIIIKITSVVKIPRFRSWCLITIKWWAARTHPEWVYVLNSDRVKPLNENWQMLEQEGAFTYIIWHLRDGTSKFAEKLVLWYWLIKGFGNWYRHVCTGQLSVLCRFSTVILRLFVSLTRSEAITCYIAVVTLQIGRYARVSPGQTPLVIGKYKVNQLIIICMPYSIIDQHDHTAIQALYLMIYSMTFTDPFWSRIYQKNSGNYGQRYYSRLIGLIGNDT